MNGSPAYLDFGLDISDIDGQTFTVVVRSDVGEAREVTAFPYEQNDLENQLLKLENALLRSTELHRSAQSPQENAVEAFGRTLFEFLLPGDVRSLYNECMREATHRHRGVRLKLSIHSSRLATLPWEFLYDPRKRDYICLNPYTPLVRYTELPQTAPPLSIDAPLRILGLLADPTDMPVRLDVEQERDRVTAALRSLQERGLVELTWLEGSNWRDLQRTMRAAHDGWHIFHFIGHGGYDSLRDEGYIVLNDDDGSSHQLYASQLARLLARQRSSLRLVLLNACEGARTGVHDALSSTAGTLITSGVPAVLAMQYEITNDAAVEFANAFYEALADNLPVDASVAEARNAINISSAGSLEWGVPVLHMRAVDGQLFSIQDPTNAATADQPDPALLSAVTDWSANRPIPEHKRIAAHSVDRTFERLPLPPSSQPKPAELPVASDYTTTEDLTAVLAEAITDHVAGDTSQPAEESPNDKPTWQVIDSIDALDEGLLNDASARLQVTEPAPDDIAPVSNHRTSNPQEDSNHLYTFYDELDDAYLDDLEEIDDKTSEEDNEEFYQRKGQKHRTREVDPFDVDTLLGSYAQRQHAFIGFDWVEIPAGRFLMGSDPAKDIHTFEDEMPRLRLYLPTYKISRVPVTNAQYKLFLTITEHRPPPHWDSSEIPDGKENHPVVNVTWHDAIAFCEWAGVRLPSEMEWEKAARGDDGRLYPWGNEPPDQTRCNFDLILGMTVAVGSYPAGASPYGVLDMSGNTWEWTATAWLDSYDDYLAELEKHSTMALRRVLRGGGFRDLEFVRAASRSWDLPNQHYRDLGFRVVAT